MASSTLLLVLRALGDALDDASIDAELRRRFPDFEIRHLAGVRAWLVHDLSPKQMEEVAESLSGLPLQVAPDSDFHTLGAN